MGGVLQDGDPGGENCVPAMEAPGRGPRRGETMVGNGENTALEQRNPEGLPEEVPRGRDLDR